jgi:uncharacterized Zn finger protein
MSPQKTSAKSSTKKNVVHKTTKSSDKQPKQNTAVTPSDFSKPVREYWERLDWGNLSENFGDRTLQRGRDYAKQGCVRSLWVTEDGRNLLAVVSGTYAYKTLVILKECRRKKRFVLSSVCSCPVGNGCKHGVAVIVRFLDYLANNQPIPLCRELEDDTWEIVESNGKTKIMKIDFDEYSDDDEDDFWDDDSDEYDEDEDDDLQESLQTVRRSSLPKPGSKKDVQTAVLEERLKGKSPKELTALILHIFNEYDNVREYFEQEAFAESVAKSGDVAKLVEKAIKLIDKEVSGGYVEYDYYGHGGPSCNLEPVVAIVKQFGKFDDVLAAVDRVARHLIKKGCRYIEETSAEDTEDIDNVFDAMVKTLIASKVPPVSIILWAYDISNITDYGLADDALGTITSGQNWSAEVWSGVADAMLAKMAESGDYSVRTIVNTLDKALRHDEATDLLRTEAVNARELEMLATRLIEFGFLDEAEKLCWEQRKRALKEKDSGLYYDRSWSGHLKKIAEKKKDYPTQASIEAAAFFENPQREMISALLLTAKKMSIEHVVRRAIETFLQSGELPTAVQKGLEGVKPTAKEQGNWQIPFFAFSVEKKEQRPRFDILCEWAMVEQRPDDVVRWFDELSKHKGRIREISREKVADAICDAHPDRALRIYRELAEHEMEASRDYPAAVRVLRKIRKLLEGCGRSAEWQPLMAEVRATHRRKPSLMKQLDELEAGSIVNQKRRGK